MANIRRYLKSIVIGLISSIGLLAFYFVVMTLLTKSSTLALSQFADLWYYMTPLIIGFGVQAGFYHSLKTKSSQYSAQAVMPVNTAASSTAMIACCAHHLTDVLPMLGLSAFSLFLVNYQKQILLFGILGNFLGIIHLYRLHLKIK